MAFSRVFNRNSSSSNKCEQSYTKENKMTKLAIFFTTLGVIILIGVQVQMFTLRKDIRENREVLTETVEVLGDVVSYLTGFGQVEE